MYLFRATGNPHMATLSTDLPKHAHDRPPRIGPHRREVAEVGAVVASPVAVRSRLESQQHDRMAAAMSEIGGTYVPSGRSR